MISCFAGTLCAILSYLLLIDVIRGVTVTRRPSPGPFYLEWPTKTFEFEVIIQDFSNASLFLDVFMELRGVPVFCLRLNWSNPVSTIEPSIWKANSRWASMKSTDNEKEKSYMIRLSNVTADDAGKYNYTVGAGKYLVVSQKQTSNTSEFWLNIKCILITDLLGGIIVQSKDNTCPEFALEFCVVSWHPSSLDAHSSR